MAERDDLWEATVERVASMRDGYGRPVDEGIRETVVALNALGFPTTTSCEGHLDMKPYPFVEISAPGWREEFMDPTTVAAIAWIDENYAHERALLRLLEGFYAQRHVPYPVVLAPIGHELYGSVQLRSVGAEAACIEDVPQQAECLRQYQAEMTAFADHLRTLFFRGGGSSCDRSVPRSIACILT